MVKNMKTTLTEKINWTKYNLAYPELGDVIQMIRTGDMQLHDNEFGDYTLKQAIEHIRSVAPGDMRKWKARLLPAVAYNGTFRELNGAGLIEYSRVTALDFDHIATPDEMIRLRNKLMITECVLSVFVTPSGNGLRLWFCMTIQIRPDMKICMDSYWINSMWQTEMMQAVKTWHAEII